MDTQPIALDPPNPRVRIRPVLIRDIPGLCHLWSWRSESDVAWMVKRVQQQARQGRGLGAVIMDDHQRIPAGYGQVTLWYRAAEIADLAIAESHRGQGLGTVLIQYLVRVAREMNAPRVEIGVALVNTRALNLYRRLGFQDDRTVLLDVGEGVQPVLYLNLDLK
jgi:ribosomal protein S18 acetylase RimI-like enzyme